MPHQPVKNRLWVSEFGETFACPDLPQGWVDTSWHNDVCPSYAVGDVLAVFMDHPVAPEREFPESPRYTVHDSWQLEHTALDIAVPLMTEDWQEVLDYVDWHLRCVGAMV